MLEHFPYTFIGLRRAFEVVPSANLLFDLLTLDINSLVQVHFKYQVVFGHKGLRVKVGRGLRKSWGGILPARA